MQILARRYDTRQPVLVQVHGGTIDSIQPVSGDDNPADLPWIAPGLVDLQVNGFRRISFNSPDLSPQDVAAVSRDLDSGGVTGYCPTVTTDSGPAVTHAVATIAQALAADEQVRRRVIGIHVEGPYISPEDGPRGAHPRRHVRPPDWDEFQRWQEAAQGQIRILTLSPEYENSADFIARVAASGVLVAIGHTSADSQQIRAAVDAGARLSTHLGNGAHPLIRRHPNYIWDQLAEDRLTASLIVDGHHLPPEVVKTFLRAKTPARCIAVSDITALAGLSPGRYQAAGLDGVDVLEDGRLVVAGQRELLAGANLPLAASIANLIRFTGCDLQVAVERASTAPAALVGHRGGRLERGAPADLMLFHLAGARGEAPLGQLQVRATVLGGELVWGQLASPR